MILADGVRRHSGRQGGRLLIDMHAKGLDETTLNLGLETGLPVCASPKYLAEHVGLSYHPSAIREREYPAGAGDDPTGKNSASAPRRFLPQSYGDLLPADKKWKVVFRVWPGHAACACVGRSRACRRLWPQRRLRRRRRHRVDGADVVQGPPGHGDTRWSHGHPRCRPGDRGYDWEKYLLQYRLWGRLSFSPDARRRRPGGATSATSAATRRR